MQLTCSNTFSINIDHISFFKNIEYLSFIFNNYLYTWNFYNNYFAIIMFAIKKI